MHINRKFIIIPVDQVEKIDFTQIEETSIETLRYSVDNTKTFVKYYGEDVPSSISNISGKDGPYTYTEFLAKLSTSDWTRT